jgi:DNA-binding NarL/FixJ family response regulator
VDFEGYLADYRAKNDPRPLATSKRRLECLRYASHGLEREAVADAMGITVETVMTHLAYARRDLGARNTMHACCIALRLGLID